MGILDETEEQATIDPSNVYKELVQYFSTSARYVHRQGLSWPDMRSILDMLEHPPEPPTPFVPELRDRGINDMRGKH